MAGISDLWTYYDRRADEYEAGTVEGLEEYASEIRAEDQAVTRIISDLTFTSFLDIGAGTGIFTRHLSGRGIVLDQSPSMLRRLRDNLGVVPAIRADARSLPLRDGALDCVFAGHLYGHLEAHDRKAFLREAHRVGRQLVILDSGRRPGQPAETWETRRLANGDLFSIFKRFFTGTELANEVGGHALYEGSFFVLVLCDSGASHLDRKIPVM